MMKPIESRRSIRRYTDQPVADDTIMTLLESARMAPSGNNTQPWHFIVITDQVIKRQLATMSHDQQWMLTAPVFIACVADSRARIPDREELVDEDSPHFALKQIIRDTSIAIDHLVLEATNEGLGTCWVSWFKQSDVRPILGVPQDKFVVSIITVGYADEAPRARPRKALKDMLHHDRW